MRLLSCALTAVALAALSLPAAAAAKRSQFTIFQATREVRSPDPAVRGAALDEIDALGVHWLRVVLYWQDVAPAPDARAVPTYRRGRIRRPMTGRSTTACRGRPRSRPAAARDRQRSRSDVGDALAQGSGDATERDPLPALRDGGRASLPGPGRLLVGLERAQPPAVPRAAVRARARRTRHACTASCSTRRAPDSNARATRAIVCSWVRRHRAATAMSSPRSRSSADRCA